MVETTRATIFVNASSGWDLKEEAPQLLESLFEKEGIPTDIKYVQAGTNLAELSRKAVADGSSIVVAAGGDGTLSAVASGLVGTDIAFGVLPVGTLNHFARDLKIPLDLQGAARVVLGGQTTEVDVGEVNGKTFLNNSILGLYPIYRFLREGKEKKGWGRRMSLLLGLASIFRKFPALKVRLLVKGHEIERKTPYILIGNNEHAMEGYHLGLRNSLCDGKLWIYVMKPRGRLGLLRILLSLIFGRFEGRKNFEIFSTEELWVETKGKRIGVALDGEVTVMDAPLRYRILPRSLKVLVPFPQ
jgi:diacylglycerol kinase family enzyme